MSSSRKIDLLIGDRLWEKLERYRRAYDDEDISSLIRRAIRAVPPGFQLPESLPQEDLTKKIPVVLSDDLEAKVLQIPQSGRAKISPILRQLLSALPEQPPAIAPPFSAQMRQ